MRRIASAAGATIETYPDFTLTVPGDHAAAASWGVDQRTALIIPNAEMQGSRNPDAAARSGYAPLLLALARRLQELGYLPRVLNHEGAADAALCDVLHAATGGAPVIDEHDPLALKGVIGAAGLVVASRFHGCANALSQAVPCLATAWSHKYGQLFADFGVGEYVLESSDAAAGMARLEALVANRDTVRHTLEARRPALAARTEELWVRVGAALGTGPPVVRRRA